jgi:ribonuclease HI
MEAGSDMWSAWCDGASRGNPGPASYGLVVTDPAGAFVKEIGHAIGINTNQVAEYEGLIRALQELSGLGARRATVFTDSEFVTKQYSGVYRAKDARMQVLLARVKALAVSFTDLRITHIRRSSHPNNVKADKLANQALDLEKKKA